MSVAVGTDRWGLQVGRTGIKSVGPLTFGPEGILFVADNAQATIFAIDVDDRDTASEPQPINVENLDTRLAAYLGCAREDVFIKDMAVHPASENVYLSVMRGSGADAIPLLIKVSTAGALSETGKAWTDDGERSERGALARGNGAPASSQRRCLDRFEGLPDGQRRDRAHVDGNRSILRIAAVYDRHTYRAFALGRVFNADGAIHSKAAPRLLFADAGEEIVDRGGAHLLHYLRRFIRSDRLDRLQVMHGR
jgi:hypothetical protein